MKKIIPYIIRPVKLEDLTDQQTLAIKPRTGYFFSCWWQEVPLGCFFLEPGDARSEQAIREKILRTIEPSVNQYLLSAGIFTTSCRELFSISRHRLSETMNAALGRHLPSDKAEVDVSVIICTRNRSEALERCLQSLRQQACRPREIIIVDNAPSDDSTLRVVARHPGVTYCREPRPGLSVARNAGIRKARSSILAFTDDDVLLHPNWLYHVWASFHQPDIAAMTGLVMPNALDTESQQVFEKDWSFGNGCCDRRYDNDYFKAHLAAGPPVWEIGAGANMAFRRNVFITAGYFDERLGAGAAGCSEDSEMWYRILSADLVIQYNPRAVVYHEHRQERAALQRQLYCYMRGHAAAALIQQAHYNEARYRKYLFRKVIKSYLPLLARNACRRPDQFRLLLIQVFGIFSGVLFYIKNRNKAPQSNLSAYAVHNRR